MHVYIAARRHTAAPRVVVTIATAYHAARRVLTGPRWAGRIGLNSTAITITAIPVLTVLIYVAAHVVKT